MASTNMSAGIETLIPFAKRFAEETGNNQPLRLLDTATVLAEKLDKKIAAI